MGTPRSSIGRSALLAVLLLAVLAPAAARACSCVPPDMIIDELGAPGTESVAFTGTVGPAVGTFVPVQVLGWFGGAPPAAIVSLEVSPGDGASCGTNAPPAGRQFLFVSHHAGNGAFGLNLCSVAADLATPDGQAILRSVTDKLGPPVVPVEQPPPEPAPDPTEATTIFGLVVLPTDILAFGAALALAVVLVGGSFLVAERRRTERG